jgi:cytochrome c oxidase subunit 3
MTMAGAKNHDYHILAPDIWPMIGASSSSSASRRC